MTLSLPRPRALLLDFGGVVFLTTKNPAGPSEATDRLAAILSRAGHEVNREALSASISAGHTALKHWKHASSRRRHPKELSHREIVMDFLTSDLPDAHRHTLATEARRVLHDINSVMSHHTVRTGIFDLLAVAREHDIPVVIVSNAHSGDNHRRLLRAHGLDHLITAQIYSDEVGIRKPNPEMIELGAAAAGVDPHECWYVGDTMDRDVVTGRRAGVGAVFLTTSQHTANPPFAVADAPDAIVAEPADLVPLFAEALTRTVTPPAVPSSQSDNDGKRERPVLFLDHGGVISTSHSDDTLLTPFMSQVAQLLSRAGRAVSVDEVRHLLTSARAAHKDWKAQRRWEFDATGQPLREITAREFWVDLFGGPLSDQERALLRTEAVALMAAYGRAKSRRTQRPGIHDLVAACHSAQVPVVVVSNTVSGVAVRAECAAIGIDQFIAAYVCSDEVGVRKPDARILEHAVAVVNADPATSWFVGDKPENDAVVARSVGVANRVVMRGGATPDHLLEEALNSGLATHIVDSPRGVLDAMTILGRPDVPAVHV